MICALTYLCVVENFDWKQLYAVTRKVYAVVIAVVVVLGPSFAVVIAVVPGLKLPFALAVVKSVFDESTCTCSCAC